MQFSKEYWIDGAVEVEFVPDPLLEDVPIVVVGTYTFSQTGHMVLTKNQRGWDNPGGRVEVGESIHEALHREIDEEIGAKVSGEPVLVGHLIAQALRPHAWSHKYPRRTAMPVFLTLVELREPFVPQLEAVDRTAVLMHEARRLHHAWSPQRLLTYVKRTQTSLQAL